MSITGYFSGAKPAPKRKNIFISYRVSDSAGITGRLVDSLKQHFQEDQIFMDIDKIEPGVDFTDVISTSLEGCDVMLAVIGPTWAGKNAATGTSRIKETNDWVRLEIATALRRNIRVVPVLVDSAPLPLGDDLPDDLHPLLKRQTYELSNKRWRYDTENLVAFLEKSVGIPTKHLGENNTSTNPSTMGNVLKWGLMGIGALFIILIIAYSVNPGGNQDAKNLNGLEQTDPVKTLPPAKIETPPQEKVQKNETPLLYEPAPKPVAASKNIEGTWSDANGMYYMMLTQNGTQVDVASYSMAGQKTGEGFGVVNGSDFSFKISVAGFGIMSAKTKVSGDEYTVSGKLTIENNGAVYTEPLTWRKQ